MSNNFVSKSKNTLIFLSVFTVIGIAVFTFLLTPQKKLPVYNPIDVNPALVDISVRNIETSHKIKDFSLIDQQGKTLTSSFYEGKIYIADFFFTQCQTICPIMTTNMKMLQDFYADDDILFLSHSVTPIMDSVPVIKEYAKSKGANYNKWKITTGDKRHIYDLARKSYMVATDEGDGGVQDFIHTENFVLIDKNKRIRGYYDGTDNEDMDRLKVDIEILKKEKTR
ncbi:MAG: SCO family protein [Flavobacteriaceae bacterium]|nr:SCO family protein [Flavobacteriaceae bacterium]